MHGKASCESNVTIQIMQRENLKCLQQFRWFEPIISPVARLDKRLSQNSMKVSKQIQQILLNYSPSFKTEWVKINYFQ